jgi:hypothetical protein
MLLFSYGIFLFFVVLFELLRKKSTFVDFLTIFHIYFVVSYLLVPFVYLLDTENTLWKFLSADHRSSGSWTVLFSIASGYALLVTGFTIGHKLKNANSLSITPRFGSATQFRVFILLFFLFVSFLFLYSMGHGGLFGLMTSGQAIRSGASHGGLFQYFLYFASGIKWIPLFFLSAYLFSHTGRIRNFSLLSFIFSLVLAIVHGLGTGGRANTGMIIIYLFLLWLIYDSPRMSIKKIFGFSFALFFILFMIYYGRSAIVALSALADGGSVLEAFLLHSERYHRQSASSSLDYVVLILRHFDHHFASLYQVLFRPDLYESPRLFWDYPRAIFSLIPGEGLPDAFVSSMPAKLNARYFNALDPRIVGNVPLSWVGMKIVNGGFFWLIVGSFWSGLIGGVIGTFLQKNIYKSVWIPAFFIYTSFLWKDYLIAPEGTEFVFGSLQFIFFIATFLFLFKLCKAKHQPEKGKKTTEHN